MPYRTLDAEKIEQTLRTLQKRIDERFPGRGLSMVCRELVALAEEDRERVPKVTTPNRWLQGAVAMIILGGAVLLAYAARLMPGLRVDGDAFSMFQGIEAILNVVALTGAAAWFLLNLDARIRRERILSDLHELRSIAHVIDMHQLTKDPTFLLAGASATASSPSRGMTEFELTRYLDYCSEMLSLTAKLAALYMQTARDPAVISAVTEIEDLTGNLSRKIWQKIMILRRLDERRSS